MKSLTNEEINFVSGGGDSDEGIEVWGMRMNRGTAFNVGMGMYDVGHAVGGNATALGVAAAARAKARGSSVAAAGGRGSTITAVAQVAGTALVDQGCDIMSRSGLLEGHPYYANQCGLGHQLER